MDFCYKTATVWQMVGKFLFILKILIPILTFFTVNIGISFPSVNKRFSIFDKCIFPLSFHSYFTEDTEYGEKPFIRLKTQYTTLVKPLFKIKNSNYHNGKTPF